MNIVVSRSVAAVALSLTCAACIVQGGTTPPGDESEVGGGDASELSGVGGGSTCMRSSRPSMLRQVRVADSRLVEPNTVVFAASQDPQTLWLPAAGDNEGAYVVVKE